jgi:hypothetical protein
MGLVVRETSGRIVNFSVNFVKIWIFGFSWCMVSLNRMAFLLDSAIFVAYDSLILG